MISHWSMPTPGLVCSVQSGSGNYNLTFEESLPEAGDVSLAQLLEEHTPANGWGSTREKQKVKYEGKIKELMKGVVAASVECGAWLTSTVPNRAGGMIELHCVYLYDEICMVQV